MIEKIIETIFKTADDWHKKDLTVFELPPQEATAEGAAVKVLYHNYQTWHLIDLYKSDPAKVPYDSHGITHNKLRNYAIAELDDSLTPFQKGTGKMHSETLGDILDKISILYLKMLHVRGELSAPTRQHLDILISCAKELFGEMVAGTRQCPNIKRFKV